METYLLDWASLLLRWLHVITAIAWIGTSFHFVLTDDRLYKPTDPDLLAKGVDGESWAVHGGGFYHFNKYRVAPKHLPAEPSAVFTESATNTTLRAVKPPAPMLICVDFT